MFAITLLCRAIVRLLRFVRVSQPTEREVLIELEHFSDNLRPI
jgi:hypothetical protein